jgi:DNA polymerase/3'-5' exonuclease PolX
MGSRKQRLPLSAALAIAERARAALAPYCHRVEIAGSVRRGRPFVGDLEIVAQPLQEPSDLFGEALVAHHGFCAVVNGWRAIKGQPTGKYTQRRLPEGITLDLFIADEENFGWLMALRTGSATFSHKVLATGMLKAGYSMLNGYVYRRGERMALRAETEVFTLIGIPFVPPSDREL